jgi:hypothetical protein
MVVIFSAICVSALFSSAIDAGFNFTNRKCRVKLTNTDAVLSTNAALEDFDGTIEIEDAASTRMLGAYPITFASGTLESGDMHALVTGKYDPTAGDTLLLEGSHKLRCDAGTLLPALVVCGSSNTVEGLPRFSSAIQLTGSESELQIGIQNKLNKDIQLAGGTLKLTDNLYLGDEAKLTSTQLDDGVPTINFNKQSLHLTGTALTWTDTLLMYDAADLELHAYTSLSGTWSFNTETPGSGHSMINGNGNILDLSLGGTIVVGPQHCLALSDVTIKGLGAGSDLTGNILLMDATSTLSCSNVTFMIDSGYTVTQGKIHMYSGSCRFIVGSNTLNFASPGNLVIDQIPVFYDNLGTSFSENVTGNITLQNDGTIEVEGAAQVNTLAFPSTTNTLIMPDGLSSLNLMTVASTTTIDGQGFLLQMPRDVASVIQVSDGACATLTNVVLRDFSPKHVKLNSTGELGFGDGCRIELGAHEEISEKVLGTSFGEWWFSGGSSIIMGHGNNLTLAMPDAIRISSGATLTLQDVQICGLSDQNYIKQVAADSKVIWRNSDILLDADFTFTEGIMDFYDHVNVYGIGHKFSCQSDNANAMKVYADSTLKFDRGTTLEYNISTRTRFAMAEESARLFLSGATLEASTTGIDLTSGTLVIDDRCYLNGSTSSSSDAITLRTTLRTEILTGAMIDADGYIEYATAAV